MKKTVSLLFLMFLFTPNGVVFAAGRLGSVNPIPLSLLLSTKQRVLIPQASPRRIHPILSSLRPSLPLQKKAVQQGKKESEVYHDLKELRTPAEDLDLQDRSKLARDYEVKGHNEADPLFERIKNYQTAIKLYNKVDDGRNRLDALLAFCVELKIMALQAQSTEELLSKMQTDQIKKKIRILDGNYNSGHASQEIGESYLFGFNSFPKDYVQAEIYFKQASKKGNSDADSYLREYRNDFIQNSNGSN